MAFTLARIDRVYREYDVAVTEPNGAAAAVAGVDVALLTPRRSPGAATTWVAATFAGGVATLLLAGPEADPTGALVVPVGGADLWLRVTDTPEVIAAYVERISVR